MPDGRRLERRARHEGEQPCRARELLGRRLQREVHLRPLVRKLELEASRLGLRSLEHVCREEAVPALGGHAPRRGVRVREQPPCLELRQLVADGGRRHRHRPALNQALRSHRDAGGHILLDNAAQDLLLARATGGVVEAPFAGILRQQLGCDAAAEQTTAGRQHERRRTATATRRTSRARRAVREPARQRLPPRAPAGADRRGAGRA